MLAFLALIYGDTLDKQYNVIGIRVATLLVAFASFVSSTTFSFLIYYHNRTVSKINDDTNKRAELFRDLQFASSNYSIIEFMDRMLIYNESSRYIKRFIERGITNFHMLKNDVSEQDVSVNPDKYNFISIRIPFRVIEGKMVSKISFDKITFERDQTKYIFTSPTSHTQNTVFLLYNELTKRNNVIVNLVFLKESSFIQRESLNHFTKIKININITSLLGVQVKGVVELHFTNPEQIEGDGKNTYRINSSNFTLTEMPKVININY
jgi:hypothetical protein